MRALWFAFLIHSLSICVFGEGRQPSGLFGKLRSLQREVSGLGAAEF